jgi:AcrR family transcriptional regulator
MTERELADGTNAKNAAPLPLRERNKLRTRHELLQAALEVFADAGYSAATVESIAARAGTSKVTLYTYFPQGREELYCVLYEQINVELIAAAERVYSEPGHFADRIGGLTQTLLDVAQRPLVGRFYSLEDPSLESVLNPVRGHASRAWISYIAADLRQVKKAGGLRTRATPQALATMIVGTMRSALTEVSRGRAKPDQLANAVDSLVRGLEQT